MPYMIIHVFPIRQNPFGSNPPTAMHIFLKAKRHGCMCGSQAAGSWKPSIQFPSQKM